MSRYAYDSTNQTLIPIAGYTDGGPAWNTVTGKPFESVGTGLTVINNALRLDQSEFDISDAGLPSDTSIAYQQLTLGTTIGKVNGSIYMESDTKTTADGIDTFTFTNAIITNNAAYDFYCDVFGVALNDVVVSTGSMDVKFNSSDNVTLCRVYIK